MGFDRGRIASPRRPSRTARRVVPTKIRFARLSQGRISLYCKPVPFPKRPLVTCPTRGPCKPPLREEAVFVENRGLFGRKTRVLREKNVILAGVFSSFRGFYGSKWLARKNYRSLASCQKNPPETRPSVFVFLRTVVISVRDYGKGHRANGIESATGLSPYVALCRLMSPKK